MSKRTIITSALPYANGPIHLGHLVEYIQTDIYTRLLKLTGEDAIYCCADDTHGTPIEIKSNQLGIKPEELIEKYYKEHIKDFSDFLINFDSYYSTNSEENRKFSDFIFNSLKDKGYVFQKEIEQTYCENCNRFLPDRFVKGECPKCDAQDQYGDSCEVCNSTYSTVELKKPYCTICKNPPIRKKSNHYFVDLKKFTDFLTNWIENDINFQPEIKNYVLDWINKGLHDWDISRDAPYFGFNIDGEKDKFYYVWLDAPIGYIASTENYCKNNNLDVDIYWRNKDSKIIHFIGKDIIYFHCLFWPAMLYCSGFNLPSNIFVHGFLKVNGEKMSKSKGTFITARQYLDSGYDPEYLRYYYASALALNINDIDLNLEDFKNKINTELIGNILNLFNRTLQFINKNFNGEIKNNIDNEFYKSVNENLKEVLNYFKELNFREAVRSMLKSGDMANKYFQENEPWKLVKSDPEKAHWVLNTCAHILRDLAVLLKPVIPRTVDKIENILNIKINTTDMIGKELEVSIQKPEPLMKKIEEMKINTEDPFDKIEIVTAKILEIKEHPEADKLYILKIDIGTEERQLVAGLRTHYSAEELQDKNIIVLKNLKPAKLRGEWSQGMLLAADNGDVVKIITSDSGPGKHVYSDSIPEKEFEEIEIKDYMKLGLKSKNGKVFYNDNILKTEDGDIKAPKNVDGKVK